MAALASWTAVLAIRTESIVIAVLVLVGIVVIAALLHPASVRADERRVELDLQRRGAQLLEMRPLSCAGDKNEAGYDVEFLLADGTVRRAVCKTSDATGVWWQGDVPWVRPPEAAPRQPSARVVPGDAELARLAELSTDADAEGRAPPPGPVEDLLDVLHGGEPDACAEAIAELARHGPAVLPRLERELEDADPDVRIDVQRAIDRIRGAAPE